MFDKEYSEKRDFIRMFVDADVTFNLQGEKTTFQGKSRELSGKGVSFITSQSLNEGDVVNITVSAVDARVAPLEIVARVVRTENLDNGKILIATVKVD